jgi:hypothetical protein
MKKGARAAARMQVLFAKAMAKPCIFVKKGLLDYPIATFWLFQVIPSQLACLTVKHGRPFTSTLTALGVSSEAFRSLG